MPDGTQIVVQGAQVNSKTGHHTIFVKAVTTEGNVTFEGPQVGYGVDPQMFKHRFNRDINQVLSWVASEHLAYNGANQELVSALGALKGRVIG